MSMCKVGDLSGSLLNEAVAKAEGIAYVTSHHGYRPSIHREFDPEGPAHEFPYPHSLGMYVYYKPSEEWDVGGPIIERERIHIDPSAEDEPGEPYWMATTAHGIGHGPTPLIAAMRCYVAHKFGPTEEIDL
jgi:hypothetical protein